MKTTSFIILSILLVASATCIAANYNITFTGSGAISSVGEVIVQNLTKGTTVTVPGGNILNLSDRLSEIKLLNNDNETIHVYRDSEEGVYTLKFFAKKSGNTQINVHSLDGRRVVSINRNLEIGINSFHLTLHKGYYAIRVLGNGYAYNDRIINQSASLNQPGIVYTGTEKITSVVPQKSKNSNLETTSMIYTTGDRLLYKGISGNYSTIIIDVPTADKTINFDFTACTDGDGNNYTVVKIGNQTWMAENLKTTKYNDGNLIPNVTNNDAWRNLSTPAYCWYNNDSVNVKNIFGALYNRYATASFKLAPTGWHIPTNAEWRTLQNYLMANGYNSNGTTTENDYAKSLASTTSWAFTTMHNCPGNNPKENNSSGFSALAGGRRTVDGEFNNISGTAYWWTFDGKNKIIYNFENYVETNIDEPGYNNGFSIRCIKD